MYFLKGICTSEIKIIPKGKIETRKNDELINYKHVSEFEQTLHKITIDNKSM
jgi:hypothetical protein